MKPIIKRGIINEIDKYIDTSLKTLIITDSMIPLIYIDKVRDKLDTVEVFTVTAGETSKSFSSYLRLINHLSGKYNRNSQIIAIGGGVIGDLAGFVAATYMRGINYINVPTSLIAQVDSSVGGKVGVNLNIKNEVGSFYNPEIVLIDPDLLSTLDRRHFNNGMAEVIKYALLFDKELLAMIESDSYEITELIEKCICYKNKVVKEDEFDRGARRILNLGHTLGHAIEFASEYDLLHGEAIAHGILSIISDDLYYRVESIFKKFDLLREYKFSSERIIELIKKDKKSNGKLTLVLLDDIEKPYIKEVEIDNLSKYIRM